MKSQESPGCAVVQLAFAVLLGVPSLLCVLGIWPFQRATARVSAMRETGAFTANCPIESVTWTAADDQAIEAYISTETECPSYDDARLGTSVPIAYASFLPGLVFIIDWNSSDFWGTFAYGLAGVCIVLFLAGAGLLGLVNSRKQRRAAVPPSPSPAKDQIMG